MIVMNALIIGVIMIICTMVKMIMITPMMRAFMTIIAKIWRTLDHFSEA